ncbi:hypothetical protein F3Y22_tig00110633pilonHSYRG00021 [Hibiscus syriacus]|uniref:Protein kinase domain-containing protein n=1 Tax=Hibiscus syriacus TaxID=106335 RepID=A0A6A2ZZT6_HIBSY|nr:hypothetical protein F3Y22_tig00110633pilonHSYRG00021 [Hibiscus syriacus]
MERYEILKDIGSGNFGVAKLARDKRTGEHFAVKYIERGPKSFKSCFFPLPGPVNTNTSCHSHGICSWRRTF